MVHKSALIEYKYSNTHRSTFPINVRSLLIQLISIILLENVYFSSLFDLK
jgi:hypothetical protein